MNLLSSYLDNVAERLQQTNVILGLILVMLGFVITISTRPVVLHLKKKDKGTAEEGDNAQLEKDKKYGKLFTVLKATGAILALIGFIVATLFDF